MKAWSFRRSFHSTIRTLRWTKLTCRRRSLGPVKFESEFLPAVFVTRNWMKLKAALFRLSRRSFPVTKSLDGLTRWDGK